MNVPEKSSDEILKELFGLCQQRTPQYETSSEDSSLDSSESDSSTLQKKHKHKKKKKKKHKKVKKRRITSSDREESEDKSHKRRKRIKEEPETTNVDRKSKVETKIKKEKDTTVTIKNEKITNDESPQNKENQSNNYINTITGMPVTLDDVFHTLGIVTEEQTTVKIKKEKDDSLPQLDRIKKEKSDSSEIVKCKEEKNVESVAKNSTEKKMNELQDSPCADSESKKTSISEVFTTDSDKQITSSKKINIINLKNSVVYETTMKEIEAREKQKAEKYEEGELSSSSGSSDEGSVDTDMKDVNLLEDTDRLSDGLKRKHKSHEKRKRKHRSHSRKKKNHRHKEDRKESKSHKKESSSDHNHHRVSQGSPDRSHQKSPDRAYHRIDTFRSHSRHHHNHHNERTRSLSAESESPRRSHKFGHRKEERSRDRSRSRSRGMVKTNHRKSKSVERIDKQKLLEIARKNAINLLQQGTLPASVITSKSKIASIKAGGKTVDELTDFCKQLSKKEAEGDDSDHDGSTSENDDTKVAFHHPFQLKDRPSSIVMNIRNAISLPTKTAQEKTLELSKQLSLQYPVSSGQQHQSVWVPVEKPPENISTPQVTSSYSNAIVDPRPNVTCTVPQPVIYPMPAPYPALPPQPESIAPPTRNIDIGSIVAQRLEAIRRLNENPQDPVGTNLIQTTDSKMTVWAESKVLPGLFTGSTGVKPLSVAELSSGFRAWPKKNQFIAAKPVYSDKGEALMKKMGWQPGEGLGKYKQGPAAPCEISLKTDRKGLTEQPQAKGFKQGNTLQKAIEITQGKHPVSLLNEFCSRRKMPTPQYDCEEKEGMGRRKLFLFSVIIQGTRYTPKMPSNNKKQSKMEAATVCLQSLGLLPASTPTI